MRPTSDNKLGVEGIIAALVFSMLDARIERSLLADGALGFYGVMPMFTIRDSSDFFSFGYAGRRAEDGVSSRGVLWL